MDYKEKNMDVEPTAETIDAAAKRFRQTADALDRIAKRMRSGKDLSYAAEAVSEMLNALQNSRIDLLVTRPIRAFENEA
jgi:uncharacterized Fe-S cluster-containing radical SAM superfamily enzyme